jgi:hypothetical protein
MGQGWFEMSVSNEPSFNNSYVLQTVLPTEIVNRISEFAAEVEEEEEEESPFDWDEVGGTVEIYRTRHIITRANYFRGTAGGYVFLYREHPAGWYHWDRYYDDPPRYTMVDGILIQKIEGSIEYLDVVPHDFEYDGEEDITILDVETMMEAREEGW